MTVYEMEGFLRGKCVPGDMKVNESNAQYLVRKFSEFETKLSESNREFRAADATIHNLELKITDMAVQLANAESKCRELAAENEKQQTHSEAMAVDNAALREVVERVVNQFAMSGISPEEKSVNPAKSLMFDAKSALFMPATDAFLAEVRASALEYYANLFKDTVNMDVKHNQEFHKGTLYVADQLRKGAAL
ncbi:TPA: hypothetical protein NDT34_002002 [Citrobacter freundii]|nr:hypothetical protein [Citrobacter freundii]HCD1457197.1 hypothetical protein [Citrobacter freundii]HCD2016534.1 hypothetical protein [Citrobacter freundii]HCD3567908.1 hypothetical protein [Citrobacter freundii]HCD4630418.1 hypothetical protein [Citrobacter freundii]